MDWETLIESQPALAVIPHELRELAKRRDIEIGETLFRLGDRLRGIFYVVSGEIRLVRRARNGTDIVMQRSRGGFFAEASFNTKVYHCDAVVAEPGAVLCFPVQAFRAALATDVVFRNAWMVHLARELLKSRARCERLGLKSAEQRIVHYIESEGADGIVSLSASRKAWATELGLTHEALYRTLRRLQANGMLDIDENRIILHQRKKRTSPVTGFPS